MDGETDSDCRTTGHPLLSVTPRIYIYEKTVIHLKYYFHNSLSVASFDEIILVR